VTTVAQLPGPPGQGAVEVSPTSDRVLYGAVVSALDLCPRHLLLQRAEAHSNRSVAHFVAWRWGESAP
jgi:hypothetical protein